MLRASALFAAVIGCCVVMVAGIAAPRGKWIGSTKVSGKKSMAVLKKLAKITPVQASRIALAAVSGVNKTVLENELEVERGFLVYCVDIKVAGQQGEHEVLVDPATGKVLAQQLEDDDDEEDDEDD